MECLCLERGSRYSAQLRFGLPESLEPGLLRSLCPGLHLSCRAELRALASGRVLSSGRLIRLA